MSENVTIFHNPRCSKSRAALQLLRDRGVQPTVVEYLRDPPSAQQIRELLRMLDMRPRELMRRKETVYAEQGLDAAGLDDAALIAAMHAHPVLIERPIVVAGTRAALGRPPENVLSILPSP